MKVKTIVKIGCLMLGSYWLGKMFGVGYGAKTVLNKYTNIIPEDEVVIHMVDKPGLIDVYVTAKKGK